MLITYMSWKITWHTWVHTERWRVERKRMGGGLEVLLFLGSRMGLWFWRLTLSMNLKHKSENLKNKENEKERERRPKWSVIKIN